MIKRILFVTVALIIYRVDCSINWQKANPYQRSFRQKLDHFNLDDQRTWNQRYFVNDEFYNGQVAFLMIGGEGAIDSYFMTNGAWITYAKFFRPILFHLEHRYYGQSLPTKDLKTKNLVYLSSYQALGDISTFISNMNVEYHLPYNIKWIVFGCSYAGSLAAWIRQKLPNLVHGAVVESAPILAKLGFPEYYESLVRSLSNSNKRCPLAIRNAKVQIESLLQSDSKKLESIFNLCNSLNREYDVATFFESIANTFAAVVQYDKMTENDISIKNICNIMINTSIGPECAYVLKLVNNIKQNICYSAKYDNTLYDLQTTIWRQNQNRRQWFYQLCTEFGFFSTSSSTKSVFGNYFDTDYYIKLCRGAFNLEFTRSYLEQVVSRTNNYYGGLDINVTNVVFVQGSADPWNYLGFKNTKSKNLIWIHGASHCAAVDENGQDSREVKIARNRILVKIGSWLGIRFTCPFNQICY